MASGGFLFRLFKLDAAARAVHAAHGVDEKDQDAPEGDELEAPLGQRVVARGLATADRADLTAARSRPDRDLQNLLPVCLMTN